MQYAVVFTPEAQAQLNALYDYIPAHGAPDTAEEYVAAIIDFCESLQDFHLRGVARNDVRTGLRITHFKKRAVIAYAVTDVQVAIIGVYYGGQDYESQLQIEVGDD